MAAWPFKESFGEELQCMFKGFCKILSQGAQGPLCYAALSIKGLRICELRSRNWVEECELSQGLSQVSAHLTCCVSALKIKKYFNRLPNYFIPRDSLVN